MLKISPFMELRQRVMRELHNADRAYGDALDAIEHRLATVHFEAIAAEDEEEAAEALEIRVAMGFLDAD